MSLCIMRLVVFLNLFSSSLLESWVTPCLVYDILLLLGKSTMVYISSTWFLPSSFIELEDGELLHALISLSVVAVTRCKVRIVSVLQACENNL